MRRVVPATDNSMNIVSPTHHDQEITGRFHQKAHGPCFKRFEIDSPGIQFSVRYWNSGCMELDSKSEFGHETRDV